MFQRLVTHTIALDMMDHGGEIERPGESSNTREVGDSVQFAFRVRTEIFISNTQLPVTWQPIEHARAVSRSPIPNPDT